MLEPGCRRSDVAAKGVHGSLSSDHLEQQAQNQSVAIMNLLAPHPHCCPHRIPGTENRAVLKSMLQWH